MSVVTFDVAYTDPRNRVTNAFRAILAIPHLFVMSAWRSLAQILTVVQWFIILFTGKRNRGIFEMVNQYLGYSSRVMTYTSNMYDAYPPFGTSPGATGVTYLFAPEEPANRLTNGLRLIWAIPALIIMAGLTIAGFVVVVISWFAILFTGSQPKGMFDFLVKAHRYSIQANSYVMLMTDTYPKYG